MKNIVVIILSFLFLSANAQEKSKETKTVEFKVRGNCGQCKARIENAADIKGVKLAEWDSETQILKVTYRVDKISEKKIKEAIVKAGHDIGDQKAPDATYKNLPECCQYREGKHGM